MDAHVEMLMNLYILDLGLYAPTRLPCTTIVACDLQILSKDYLILCIVFHSLSLCAVTQM